MLVKKIHILSVSIYISIISENKGNNLIIQVYQGHFLLSKYKLCVYYLNKTSIFKIYLGSDKKKEQVSHCYPLYQPLTSIVYFYKQLNVYKHTV